MIRCGLGGPMVRGGRGTDLVSRTKHMNPQMRELSEHSTEGATFVETALKLGGASAEEAQKTGALDRADEQVEDLFAPKYQTAGSPAHRAVWDKEFPIDLFVGQTRPASAEA